MKKALSLLLALMLVVSMVGCGEKTNKETEKETKKYKVGFVTFGLGGDFFQSLADTFKETFTKEGWDASYADGEFNPAKQIEACENYIAMDVDVLVIWAVAPEAMDDVVNKAIEKGIKVISFVAPLSKYDALMVSDDAELADNCAKMAAKWIDETYASEPDHSVPVAVFSCRTADTGVLQADELIKIENFSKKAKFIKEVECSDETMAVGQEKMENLYTTNPEIKVFLTAHNGLAQGINNFFTAVSSPVTNYDGMGIFAINGDSASAEIIKSSVDGKSPFRGMVLTGSVNDTANEMLDVCTGVMDGSLAKGYVQKAGTLFVYDKTVDEYLTTGTVTSVTADNFK